MSSPVVPAEDAAPVLLVVLGGPAGELLLQQTQSGALPPGLYAADLLVVEPLQQTTHHSLEGPASLSLAQSVEPALLHPSQAELLEEVDPRVWLEFLSVRGGVCGDGVALTPTVLIVYKQLVSLLSQ